MPGAITHYIHGQKVLNRLAETNPELELHETAYFWGCQGPDFLYAHRFLPWMKGETLQSLGSTFHGADPNALLSAMIAAVSAENSVLLASYLLGFFCHYSLDSTAHPYIQCLAKELLEDEPKQTELVFHTEVESALDTILFRAEMEDMPSIKNMGEYFPEAEETQRAIAHLYAAVTQTCFAETVSENRLYEAAKDAHKVFAWLTDRTGLKRSLLTLWEKGKPRRISSHFRPLLEDADVDWSNSAKSPWTDSKGNSRSESFFELVDLAAEKAVGIIHGLNKHNIDELTKNEAF